ncbi:uncharacterized protein LOC131597036 [Vicia villosa]|uniref:uncharacterized protein LOC131597036 n=1 Tax=Vicia villosa TaxID=3911 RepID=UPI00273C6AA6|nr:uncharacterized protein LOC131597036 [Vicia villosa]
MCCVWVVGGALGMVVKSRSYMSLGFAVAKISSLEVVAKEILSIPLIEEVVEDMLVWDEEKSEDYSVRTGYKLWRNSRSFQPNCKVDGNWDSLWNIMAPPRAAGLSSIVEYRLQTFSDAMSIILDIYSREDKKDAKRFAMVLECVWKNRVKYYSSALVGLDSPRAEGWMKCNVDTDFSSHYQTTNRGWCLRDNLGRFIIAGVAWDNVIMSPLEAEALALKEAIHSAITMNLINVIFESDS